MGRRCHHGSPRHARPPGRERRRGPIVADRPTPPTVDAADGAVVAEPQSDAAFEMAESLPATPGDVGPAEALEVDGETEDSGAERVGGTVAEPQPPTEPEPIRQHARPQIPTAAAHAAADHARSSVVHAAAAAAGAVPSTSAPRVADDGAVPAGGPGPDHGATAPQLRRFIKSRAYVPMHELRRRFGINGDDDDVTPVELDRQLVYVGLPQREGRLVGELLKGGDIGYELSLDPIAPIVVGVYPMRPIPRG